MKGIAWIALIELGLAAVAAAASAGGTPLVRPLVWRQLYFEAHQAGSVANIEIRQETLSAAEVLPQLLEAPERTPLNLSGAQIGFIASRIMVDHLLWPLEDVKVQVWFDPENGAALQRIWTRTGASDFIKRYRFTREGIYRNRSEPETRQEEALDWRQWTNIKEDFFRNPPEAECPQVTESLVLLAVASQDALRLRETPQHFCAFYKKQVHAVDLLPQPAQLLAMDYETQGTGAESRRRGMIQAVDVLLKSRSLNDDAKESETFSFLGLRGDVHIYVDPTSAIPVQVSGDIPFIGKTNFILRRAAY